VKKKKKTRKKERFKFSPGALSEAQNAVTKKHLDFA
jgi:hypothetical protein